MCIRDSVQIHPTTLYSKKPGRRFLISESVRGEGAILLNAKKERFVNELLPRDVVTKEIREEMEKEGSDHVWLSMENIDKETILKHFPNIYQHCLEEGYDVTKEPIPVSYTHIQQGVSDLSVSCADLWLAELEDQRTGDRNQRTIQESGSDQNQD